MSHRTHLLLVGGWFCVALLSADAQSTAGPEKSSDWLIVKTPFYQLHYDRGFEKDAKSTQAVLDGAVEALKKEFAGQPVEKLLREVECKVYLYPKPTDQVSEGQASLRSGIAGDKYVATIDWLTPSAFRPGLRSGLNEPMDEHYFHKTMVHEYATILLDRITRAKGGGWTFHQAPAWFEQGYEEYLGLMLSSPRNRKELLAKYVALHKSDPGRVRVGFGVGTKDPYYDGAVLLHFMHETFGKERVQAILTSREPYFEAAVGPALGVNLEEFGRRWETWRKKSAAESR